MRTIQDAWKTVYAAREAIALGYLKPDEATQDLLAMADALERMQQWEKQSKVSLMEAQP